MRAFVGAVVIVLQAAIAHAGGPFCDDEHGESKLAALERYAAGKGWKEDDNFFKCLEELYSYTYALPEKPRKRVLAACELAVVLPADKRASTPDGYCVDMLTRAGKGTVGSRDFVAETITFGERLAKDRDASGKMASSAARGLANAYETAARTGDGRARGFVLAQFGAYRTWWRTQKRHPKNWESFTDLEYQEIGLLHALELVGTHDDVALIEEIGAEHGRVASWKRLVDRARKAAKAR